MKANLDSLCNFYSFTMFFRLYDAYSFQMIPVLGEVIAGDWKSYQYLVESIRKFPDQVITDSFIFSLRHCCCQCGCSFLQIRTILNMFVPSFIVKITHFSSISSVIKVWYLLLYSSCFSHWNVFIKSKQVNFISWMHWIILLQGQKCMVNFLFISTCFLSC